MAIIACLLGGIVGLAAFIISILAFDASVVMACGLYFGSGLIVIIGGITLALIPRRDNKQRPQTA
tara:strand:+ start:345 stop:539 length:195 start_codon:yes stop_codon:yes gene_type:complete